MLGEAMNHLLPFYIYNRFQSLTAVVCTLVQGPDSIRARFSFVTCNPYSLIVIGLVVYHQTYLFRYSSSKYKCIDVIIKSFVLIRDAELSRKVPQVSSQFKSSQLSMLNFTHKKEKNVT